MYSSARRLGIPVLKEQTISTDSQRRPADLIFQLETPLAIDIAVTNPLRRNWVRHAARKAGYAANTYATTQKSAAAEEFRNSGLNIRFEPFVMEAYGALGDGVQKAVNLLAGAQAEKTHTSIGQARYNILRNIQTVLWKYNARAVSRKLLVE